MSGNGWCTHPDRQVSSDVRILVRRNELACRNAWGSDLWEDATGDEAPAARPPAASDEPVTVPAASMSVSFDDEVTSVISSDQHTGGRHATQDDDVVEQSTIAYEDDYGDYEQDERRDLLYRDSRSAIERARQRAVQRRVHPDAGEDDDVILVEGVGSATESAGEETSLESPAFEPDDFIEEEAPSSTSAVEEHDDALLSEGIRTPSPRMRRLRRSRQQHDRPKQERVTKTDPDPDDVELVLPQSAAPERGRFDSIPELSADVELPLLRRSSSTSEEPEEAVQPAADADHHASYERALKRAHALNAAARTEEELAYRRGTSATAAIESTPATNDMPCIMPDLPEEILDSESEAVPAARPVEPRRSSRRAERRSGQDPRRNWWRGGHESRRADEERGQEETRSEHQTPSPAQEARGRTETGFTGVDPGENARLDSADKLVFDLEHEEGLASFRDRLFSPAQATQAAPPIMAVQQEPVERNRKAHRPISPAIRQRYRAEREPARASQGERSENRRMENPDSFLTDAPRHRSQAAPRPIADKREQRVQPEDLLQQPEDAWYEPDPLPDFDVRSLIEPDLELLDMTIEVAPEIPRTCTTCRSFRPSEQEGRGWCTNSWAFTHRQMVNATDLACDSTIGCWWLPADDEVWLEEFEAASAATPRIDRLIAHLNPERRVAGN